MTTTKVMAEFKNIIDEEKVYDLKELKTILTDAYKKVSDEEKGSKSSKKTKKLDENGEKKPKRAPTAYNNFTSFKMKEIRTNDPNVPVKEAMSQAAAIWKDMSDEEKSSYKSSA